MILNILRLQNEGSHNMRTFEIPACKGFMMTTRTDEQNAFFLEGKDIACFSSEEELRQKVDFYLQQDKLRHEIAGNAYRKVKKHTYYERAEKILELYKDLNK